MADNLIKLDAGSAEVTSISMPISMPIQPAPDDKDKDVPVGAMEKFLGFATAFLLISFVILFAFVSMTVQSLSEGIKHPGQIDLAFVFAGSDLISTSLLRLVAAMAGSAIAFAGLIISFYTHKNQTTLMAGATRGPDGAGGGFVPNISLSTYSPGIVAIVVGAMIIGGSLFSKATHEYSGPMTMERQAEQAPPGTSPNTPAPTDKKPPGTELPPLKPMATQQSSS